MAEGKRLFAFFALTAVTVTVLRLCLQPLSVSAGPEQENNKRTATAYDPYPPGILPANLDSEIARILRETDLIEGRALARWHSLTALTLAGQPPVFQDTGTESIETLGELMLFDNNMSPGRNESCAFCHMPYAGFAGPIPSVNLTMIAYPGTAHFRAGKRIPQRYPYAPFFPVLQYNQAQGLFFGGNFWDSRATGYRLRVPDAEQAQGPPVDHLEMGFPDTACIALRLSTAVYRPLFEEVWGKSVQILSGPEIEQATQHLTIIRWNTNNPGGSPVHYGVVHYGTRPDRLIETVASPIRLNPYQATTIFRVRIDRLQEGTTYYFNAGSEGADGIRDGVVSDVKSFVVH